MELKKAITTVPYCSKGGWGSKQENVAEGKMAKRITEKKKHSRESQGEKGKKGKWKNKTWAVVTISLCNRRDEQQELLSDKTAHIKAVKRNKSSVAANPSVAESLP